LTQQNRSNAKGWTSSGTHPKARRFGKKRQIIFAEHSTPCTPKPNLRTGRFQTACPKTPHGNTANYTPKFQNWKWDSVKIFTDISFFRKILGKNSGRGKNIQVSSLLLFFCKSPFRTKNFPSGLIKSAGVRKRSAMIAAVKSTHSIHAKRATGIKSLKTNTKNVKLQMNCTHVTFQD